jgi:hypothetical protein
MAPTPRDTHTPSAHALPQPCRIRARQPYLVRAVNLGQPDLGGILDRTEGLAEALLRRHPQSPRPPSLLQSARTSERHRSRPTPCRTTAPRSPPVPPCLASEIPRLALCVLLNPDPRPPPCASHICASLCLAVSWVGSYVGLGLSPDLPGRLLPEWHCPAAAPLMC